jgi:putative flippase GtrA
VRKILTRFLFVGVINTIFGYCVYCVLIVTGLDYELAILFSTILGVLFNFKTTGSLVFKNNNKKLLFKFSFVYMVMYLINVLSIGCLLNFGLHALVAGALISFPAALISFTLLRFFVFEV